MLISHVYANLHASSLVPAWPPAYRTRAVLLFLDDSNQLMDFHQHDCSVEAAPSAARPDLFKQNSLLCARSVHSESGCRPANMQAFPSPIRPLKRSHSRIRTFRKVLAVLVELFHKLAHYL